MSGEVAATGFKVACDTAFVSLAAGSEEAISWVGGGTETALVPRTKAAMALLAIALESVSIRLRLLDQSWEGRDCGSNLLQVLLA